MASSGRSRISRLLLGAAIALLATGAALAIAYTSSFAVREVVRGIANARFDSVGRLGEPTGVVVLSDSSPRLVADAYRGGEEASLVLLLHGSSPLGRRHGLVRMLARRLHEAGHAVLALDLPGFGDSDDPPHPIPEGFRWEDGVALAARRALESSPAHEGRLVYVGHSFGAGVALAAARLEPRPQAVIALGAPPTRERHRRFGDDWLRPFALERLEHMRITPDEDSVRAMADYLLAMDVGLSLDDPTLPPALIVYGALEPSVPQAADVLATAPPHRSLLVPNSPHQYHVLAVGPVAFYDSEVLDTVVKVIDGWARRAETR